MSARLGEMLLKVGTLTRRQLEQVLSAQAVYGGKLGTNLVEMGLVDEEELSYTLSEQMGVPCLEAWQLDDLPNSLLAIVPYDLAERCRVVPVALEGKRLTLAMANPSDFKALEEIAFVTGMVIMPRVCPELRLSFALERYYGIKRAIRYIPVEGGNRSRLISAVAQATREKAGGDEVFPSVRMPMQELSRTLAGASGEAAVVHALVGYLAGEFDRGAFLRVKGESVCGVQAVEDGMLVPEFAAYSADLGAADELRRAVQHKEIFLGEVRAERPEGALVEAMGGNVPAPVLMVPVSLGGQVAAVICASDLRGRLGGGVFDLQRVAVMAELTFEMLSLRKRIVAA